MTSCRRKLTKLDARLKEERSDEEERRGENLDVFLLASP